MKMPEEKRKAKSRLEEKCSRKKEQARAFDRLAYLCPLRYFRMGLCYIEETKETLWMPIKSQN